MGQKDLAQSDYFNDKVRFADACNGILFQGKEIIRPEELQETDAEMVYREEEKRRKIIPDKVRMWKGIYIAILSVENQTKVDYKMIFRTMKAEAVNYERQWDEREKEYKRAGILHEKANLCWFGKDEKFIPVITIVIYYGTDKLAWRKEPNFGDSRRLFRRVRLGGRPLRRVYLYVRNRRANTARSFGKRGYFGVVFDLYFLVSIRSFRTRRGRGTRYDYRIRFHGVFE